MAKLVYALNVSLDGYVDHQAFGPAQPDATIFRHFIEQVRGLTGSLYGRRMYEIMRYWDEDQPGWGPEEHEYAKVWRAQPKWVVSRTLQSTGSALCPNATLVTGDVAPFARDLKTRLTGEIYVGGTQLAQSLTDLGLIDEYQLYYRPIALGSGTPFFAGPAPRLRLTANTRVGETAVRLTYVPA